MPETEIIRPQRARFALADMARSLGLVVAIVLALLLIGPARALIFPGKDRMPVADYSGYVQGYNDDSSSRAVVPVGLPSSWRANAANLTRGGGTVQLHIGWAVPGSAYAGLDEGNGAANLLMRSVAGDAGLRVLGSTTINGEQWSVRRPARGETVFTRDANGTYVVITGNATDAQLRLLAGSLR